MAEDIYGEYLEWFRERAKPGREPKGRRGLFETFLFSQTVVDGAAFALDQAFFITWICSKDAKSGRPEWFLFSELDMLPRDEDGDVLPPLKTAYTRVTELN